MADGPITEGGTPRPWSTWTWGTAKEASCGKHDGATLLRVPYGKFSKRQLADSTGVYLVVVFFQIVRVLIHIS
jgi:hypothetical protein